MAMIRLESVTKVFKDRHKEVVAVKNLNLEIEEGEFLTLLGPSGCGKTTTLRMVGGFEVPTKGRIFIAGEDVTDMPPNKRDTAMVFQSYALFPHMTVFENVAYGLRIRKVPREEVERSVKEVLEMVNLSGLESRYPGRLSGGQQQRVALARALVIKPKVLLLDEPLSNLDAKLREQMRLELKRIQRETGITFVYVTHDQAEAMVMSDRVVVMKDGEAVQIDPPDMVYRYPKNVFVATFIGRANILDAEVLEVEGGKAVVRSTLGTVRVGLRDEGEWRSGDRAKLVIRPEGITLNERGQFEGKVLNRVYTGSMEVVTLEVSGETINAEIQNPLAHGIPSPGKTVRFDLSEFSVSLIPPE